MKKAILAMHVGEFGWEVLRFAPHVLWTKIKKYKNDVKLILCTRADRLDLYGRYIDEFIPLNIEGDYKKLHADCWRLTGFSHQDYQEKFNNLQKQYEKKYKIVECIYPIIQGRRFTEKSQYRHHEMLYNFRPRPNNKKIIETTIPATQPWVVLAPRFRKQAKKRNWNHWQEFYDMLVNDPIFNSYKFIICGKKPEYVPDVKDRFYDINHIPIEADTSLTGYAIEVIKNSVLTVGSQSGIPNLSNLVGTPTLQWGNQRNAHSKKYNVKNTKTDFIDDQSYNILPNEIFQRMKDILKTRLKENQNGNSKRKTK